MHELGSKFIRQVDDPGAAMGQKTKRQISPLGGRHRRVKERYRQPEFRQMKTAGFHDEKPPVLKQTKTTAMCFISRKQQGPFGFYFTGACPCKQ
jgi:hypothetical protein